jgi:hypothetical protein
MAQHVLDARSQYFAKLLLLTGKEVKRNDTGEEVFIEEVTTMFPSETWEECLKLSEFKVRSKSGATVTVRGSRLFSVFTC